jgi:hypothetical protein
MNAEYNTTAFDVTDGMEFRQHCEDNFLLHTEERHVR